MLADVFPEELRVRRSPAVRGEHEVVGGQGESWGRNESHQVVETREGRVLGSTSPKFEARCAPCALRRLCGSAMKPKSALAPCQRCRPTDIQRRAFRPGRRRSRKSLHASPAKRYCRLCSKSQPVLRIAHTPVVSEPRREEARRPARGFAVQFYADATPDSA